MKGGYQILDLTGATAGSPVEVKGIYKAASGNNGKPVLILTNDGQRVYAEIAEDDGDFITCYISAEGKTVNITIKSDDSVTTVISDPLGASITGLEQAVNEIAGNIGDVDDLTTTSKVVVGAVNEVNSKTDFKYKNVTDDFEDLSSTTYPNLYTFNNDGYLSLRVTSSTAYIKVILCGSNNPSGTNTLVLSLHGDASTTTTDYISNGLYVRKGMRMYVDSISASNAGVRFYPIV